MAQMADYSWRRSPSRPASVKSGLTNSLCSRYGSDAQSFTSSMGRFDSCILGRETIEPQTRHTLYKIEVDGGIKKWVIYRRYRDFVLLNKKLKKLFPNFVLTLPPKRLIRDNFDKDFIQKRQDALEEFVRNILNHCEMSQSPPVVRFFRLENPPQPHESLDASQTYCENLEQTVVELKLRCRELEDDINGLQIDLASSYHSQQEAKGLVSHYEAQYSTQGTELQELNHQIYMARCGESKAREELDKLREEIKTERAHVRAACDIEKHKQELSIKTQWDELHKQTGDVNQQLTSLLSSFSELSDVNVTIAGKSFQVKAAEVMVEHTENLRKAIENSKTQQETIYKKMVEMYNKEVQELKAELARADFIAQTRTQEAETLKAEMKEIEMKYTNDIMARDNNIRDLQRQLAEAHSCGNGTEQKYFYSLVLGVKLNMVVCGFTVDEMNQMKPQVLYNRVKANGVVIENWPSWVSREIASFPTPY